MHPSFQGLDLVDGLQQNGLLFQKLLELLVLRLPQLFRRLVPVGVVDLFQQILLEAVKFI